MNSKFSRDQDEIVLVLDIDKTVVPCDDCGDILRVVAAFTVAFTTGNQAALQKLAMLLINLSLVDAVLVLRRNTSRSIRIAFCTMKWKPVVMMQAQASNSKLFVTSSTVFFEAAPIDTGFTYLSQQV